MSIHLRRSIALLAVIAALLLVLRATQKPRGPIERNRIFAADVWTGVFPYSTHEAEGYDRPVHTPYPPSYGILMGWQLLEPIVLVRVIWAVLQVGVLVLLLYHMAYWWRHTIDSRGPPIWIHIAAVVLASRYLLRDTAGGGGNLVYGALVCFACLRPGEPHGVDRHAWRGLLLGLVLAAKPTPLLFLPWLVLRGRYRTVAIALGSALVLHATPMLTMGFEGWRTAYQWWAEGVWRFSMQADVFAPAAHDFPGFEHNQWMHQSLRFALARYLGTVPEYAVIDSVLWFPGLGIPVAELAAIQRIVFASMGGLVFALLWLRRKEESGWSEGLAFAALVCLTNLISPIAWKSYWVQAIPVFFVFLSVIAVRPKQSPRLEIFLLLYFFFCVLLSGDVVGAENKELLESLFVVTIFGIGLYVASIYLLLNTRSLSAPPESRTRPESSVMR